MDNKITIPSLIRELMEDCPNQPFNRAELVEYVISHHEESYLAKKVYQASVKLPKDAKNETVVRKARAQIGIEVTARLSHMVQRGEAHGFLIEKVALPGKSKRPSYQYVHRVGEVEEKVMCIGRSDRLFGLLPAPGQKADDEAAKKAEEMAKIRKQLQSPVSWRALGLKDRNSTKMQAKKAYKSLMNKVHPDKGGDTELAQILKNHYNTYCLRMNWV